VRRPVFVKHTHAHVVPGKWQHRPIKSVSATVNQFQRVPESRRQPIINSTPRNVGEVARSQGMPAASRFSNDQPRRDVQRVEPRREAPRGESRRQPISRSAPQLPAASPLGLPQARPVAPSVSVSRAAGREVQRVEPRRSVSAAVREHRGR
jgi:hypothetical protein